MAGDSGRDRRVRDSRSRQPDRDGAGAATELTSGQDSGAEPADAVPGRTLGTLSGQRDVTTDAARAEAVVSPEAQLIRELHAAHGAALSHFVAGLVGGDQARAQDVVQETFLRAWRHPAALHAGEGVTRSWLFTVARRIAIDDWRRRTRRPEMLTAEPPDAERPDETTAIADWQVLVDALRALAYPHREVLLECYFRGSSVSEAAVRLGLPEGTVKSRTHYALHALRAALEERGGLT